MNTHTHTTLGTWKKRLSRLVISLLAGSVLLGQFPTRAFAASSWTPTLLVNTESFQIIDEGDSTTDVEIRFGGTLNEKLIWNRGPARFEFSDDVHVTGNITATGTLITDGAISTKANLEINSDNGAANAVFTFGSDTNDETLTFINLEDRFEFSDDLNVTGGLYASGALIIGGAGSVKGDLTLNSDSGAADAILTFGSDSANETLTFKNAEDRFEFSDDIRATGGIYASGTLIIDGATTLKSTLAVTGNITSNGDLTLNNDQGAADTILTFGSDSTNETVTFKNNEDRFEFSDDVNVTGGLYASGALIIGGAGSIKGDFTINSDSGAADTILTFGSDSTNETLTFKNNEDRFEVSDDLRATGGLAASGTIVVDGAAVFKSTIKLNGVTYTFPATAAGTSGKVLKSDANGILSWSTDSTGAATTTRNSGSMIHLNAEYANAVYFQSGAATAGVGTLGLRFDSGSSVNFYRWQTTRTTNQNYWIITRVRIPDQFSGWENTKPIELRHRSSGGWLEVRALDTANNLISLTGHKPTATSTWTTTTITGPETNGVFSSGGTMTLMVKMVSSGGLVTDRAYADASWINLNLETTK